MGLSIILNATVDEYYCSLSHGFGFKVLIRNPNEHPIVTNYGLEIANGYASNIVVTPIVSEASPSIRSIPIRIRNCLFENENNLSFYR